jgi:Uma2 family endonuclease
MAVETHAAWEQGRQATSENWMFPPDEGWTWDQVKELDVPFDWELVDGNIVVRGAPPWWHQQVRDELYYCLRSARPKPLNVNSEQWILFDQHTVPKADIVVFDRSGLDVRTLDCIPVSNTVLAVEVMSPGSRNQDLYLKPGIYAEAGISFYWHVERGQDGNPVVHEHWRDEETGLYVARPDQPVHTDTLITEVPFSVEIDLRSLIED